MLNQSVKQFLRGLVRKPIFSVIHFLGLSVGVTAALFIFIFVNSEFSHDKFHINSDRIVRINQTFIWGDDNLHQFASTGPGVGVALLDEIPEFEKIVRIHTPEQYLISSSDKPQKRFNNDMVLAADSSFFDVFTFPTLDGGEITEFGKPNSVVLTRNCAIKYYGKTDVAGKVLKFIYAGEVLLFEIVSVIENIPENSYIEFDMLVSMSSYPQVAQRSWSWIWTTFETYGLLNPNTTVEDVRSKLSDIPRRHAAFTLERVMGISYEDYIKSGKEWNLYLQPLEDIHLGSEMVYNRLNEPGNRTVVLVLLGVAITILVLTGVNYLNLKSTQVIAESKDSGLRKLLGAGKGHIIGQHILESVLFVFSAVFVSLLIAYYFLGLFNMYSGANFQTSVLWSTEVLLFLLVLTIVLGLLNGIIPAYILSSTSPLQILKKSYSSGKNNEWIRRGFLILQFSLSLALLASTVVVFKQLDHLYSKNLGFEKEGLLALEGLEWMPSKESFFNEVRRRPEVSGISFTTGVPPGINNGDQFLSANERDRSVPLNYAKTDHFFIETLGASIKYGRLFSENDSSNSNYVILNETAVKALGYSVEESSLGQSIIYPGSQEDYEIIGILEDFHYWSLNAPIEPLALFHNSADIFSTPQMFALVRFQGEPSDLTVFLEDLWKSYDPEVEFSFNLVTDQFRRGFQSEERFKNMLTAFAVMAFTIAMLGLFGVVLFSLRRKLKEMSIRKVLGASSMDLVFSTSKLYLLLIVVAGLFSVPLTFYFMEQWLQNFEYRIQITPDVFFGSLALILFITSIMLIYQTIRTANTNPADILRDN